MKYVALSDLHLGQTGKDGTGEFSLLSVRSGSTQAREKINSLNRVVKEFAGDEEYSLILVGDAMDLSLAYVEDCLIDLCGLIGKLPTPKELIYVVGNHDHHLWTMHCENKNVISRLKLGFYPKGGSVYEPTESQGESFSLLDGFLGPNLKCKIAYPMFYLPERNMYFTHGHLFGDLYTYVSDILQPFAPPGLNKLEMVATTNIALIELIYWLVGETGQGMGNDGIMEAIYMDSQNGRKSRLYTVLKSAIKTLLPKGMVKWIPDSWERKLTEWMGRRIIDTSFKAPKPLRSFDRYKPSEESRQMASKWTDEMLSQKKEGTRLVVGHTHISDHTTMSNSMEMFNLGGWLVEPSIQDPDTNVLLIDDHGVELRKV